MLTIRLQRSGKKHKPSFRIVLAESREHVSKKFQEILGSYNPRTKEFIIKSEERLKYWIAQHIHLSPTVHNLFVSKSIITEPKTKAFTIPKKPEEKKEETPTPVATADAPKEETVTEAPAEPATEAAAPAETPATEASAENV